MILPEEAPDSLCDGPFGIFPCDDILEQNRKRRRSLHALHPFPGRRADFGLAWYRRIAIQHEDTWLSRAGDMAARSRQRWAGFITRDTITRILSSGSEHPFAVAAGQQIHGEDNRRCAFRTICFVRAQSPKL